MAEQGTGLFSTGRSEFFRVADASSSSEDDDDSGGGRRGKGKGKKKKKSTKKASKGDEEVVFSCEICSKIFKVRAGCTPPLCR